MSELKRCKCCGVRSSGVEKPNDDYKKLISLILRSGDERELLDLIDIMRGKITTGVTTSIGSSKLAYPEEESWKVDVIAESAERISEKLKARFNIE